LIFDPAALLQTPFKGFRMRAQKLRSGKIWLGVGAAGVAVVLLLLWVYRGRTPQARADGNDDDPSSEIVSVNVIKPRAEGLERITTQPGTFQSFEFEKLRPKISGQLINQVVDRGTPVAKKQLVAEIYAPELYADLEHAKAALKRAEMQRKQTDANLVAARAELDVARTVIDQRKEEVKRAVSYERYRKSQYRRIEKLVLGGSVEKKLEDEERDRWESAIAAARAAALAVETAKAEKEAKDAKVTQAIADVATAVANVDVANAALSRAKAFVEYTKIRSDYDGRVTERNYHNGSFIRAGDKGEGLPLLVIRREDKLRLIVQVPDSDANKCDPNDPVDFTVSTLPGMHFKGYKVSRISNSQDQRSRTMWVEVDVDNIKQANGKWLFGDGMYAEVTIHLQKGAKEAFRIPSTAVRRTEGKTLVYVVRHDVIHEVPVELGQDNGREAEVLKGVGANDLVVRNSGLGVHEGMAVRHTLVTEPERPGARAGQ
jgi:RND family efflux transporter MFP subunit